MGRKLDLSKLSSKKKPILFLERIVSNFIPYFHLKVYICVYILLFFVYALFTYIDTEIRMPPQSILPPYEYFVYKYSPLTEFLQWTIDRQ